jgi:hypothetical protein
MQKVKDLLTIVIWGMDISVNQFVMTTLAFL